MPIEKKLLRAFFYAILYIIKQKGVKMINYKELIEKAIEAREMSYSPYSSFMVGAALLSAKGNIYKGCNIENAAFTPTNCAERTAVFKAVSEGERDFIAIAVVGGRKDTGIIDYCAPCGVCRQVLNEFCDYENFEVVLAKTPEDYKVYKLCEILPLGFSNKDME